MSPEQAGVHTGGALDREQTRDVLRRHLGEGKHTMLLDALEACVVPDPRIGRIEARMDGATNGSFSFNALRAILQGDA